MFEWSPGELLLLLEGGDLAMSEPFRERLRLLNAEVIFGSIEDITVRVDSSTVCMGEVIGGHDLRQFSSVHMLSYPRGCAGLLNAVADYLRFHGVRMVNVGHLDAPTKLYKYVRMAHRGVPVPATVYLPQDCLEEAFAHLAGLFDLPFVLKSVSGGKGRSTALVGDQETFMAAILRAREKQVRLLAQEFVAAGEQLRLLVFGDVAGAVQEIVKNDPVDPLSRPDWGQARLIPGGRMAKGPRDIAVAAARALDYDIAAVHLVRNWTTSLWQVVDVSATPMEGAGARSHGHLDAYARYLEGAARADQHLLG